MNILIVLNNKLRVDARSLDLDYYYCIYNRHVINLIAKNCKAQELLEIQKQ